MSIPAWKQAVIDRKRRHKLAVAGVDPEQLSQLPTWKRELVLKKKNLYVDTDGQLNKISGGNELNNDTSSIDSVSKDRHIGFWHVNEVNPSNHEIIHTYDQSDAVPVAVGIDEHVLPFSMNPWIQRERILKNKISTVEHLDASTTSRPKSLAVGTMRLDTVSAGTCRTERSGNETIIKETPSDLPEAEQEYEIVYQPGFVSKLRKRFSSMDDLLDVAERETPEHTYTLCRRSSSLMSLDDITQDGEHGSNITNNKHVSFDANLAVCDSSILARDDVVIIENRKSNSECKRNEKIEDVSSDVKLKVKGSCHYREMIPEEMPKPNTVAMFRSLFENASMKDKYSTTSVTLRKIIVDEMESKQNSVDEESLSLGEIEEVTPQSSPIHRHKRSAGQTAHRHCYTTGNKVDLDHYKTMHNSDVSAIKYEESPMKALSHRQMHTHTFTPLQVEKAQEDNLYEELESEKVQLSPRKPDKILVLEKKITELHSQYVPVRAIVTQNKVEQNESEPTILEEELIKPSKLIGHPKRNVKTKQLVDTVESPVIQKTTPPHQDNHEDDWVSVGEVQYTKCKKPVDDCLEIPFRLNRPNRQPNGAKAITTGTSESQSVPAIIGESQNQYSNNIDVFLPSEERRKTNNIKLLHATPKKHDLNENDISSPEHKIAVENKNKLGYKKILNTGRNIKEEVVEKDLPIPPVRKHRLSRDHNLAQENSYQNSNAIYNKTQENGTGHTEESKILSKSFMEDYQNSSSLPVTNIDEMGSLDSDYSDDEPTEYTVTVPVEETSELIQDYHPATAYIIHSYDEPPQLPSSVPPTQSCNKPEDVPVSNIDEFNNSESDTDSGIYLIQSSFGHVIYTTLNETEEDDEDESSGYDEFFNPEFEGSHVIINGKSSLIKERNKKVSVLV